MQSNEYIKKQTVYEILDGMKRIRDENPAGLISDTVSACIRCVEGNVMVAHAEDVVPVRHGRWVQTKNFSGLKCSECGARVKNGAWRTHNWCYSCGARMDLEG